jgi:hypothetical protein
MNNMNKNKDNDKKCTLSPPSTAKINPNLSHHTINAVTIQNALVCVRHSLDEEAIFGI